MRAVRVLTYNIWDGGINQIAGDRQARLLQILGDSKADIIAIQEAKGFSRNEFDTLSRWGLHLGMQGAIAPAPSGFHVALLIRPPLKLLSSEAIHERIFYNACMSAQIGTPEGVLHVMTVHLNPFDPLVRLSEARHLAREAYDDRPVLLMGDFNGISPRDTVDATVLDLPTRVLARHVALQIHDIGEKPPIDTRAIGILEWSGFVDLYRAHQPSDAGWTIPTKAPNNNKFARMRLDYIFASPPLARRLVRCEVLQTPTTDGASDHYPVLADFS